MHYFRKLKCGDVSAFAKMTGRGAILAATLLHGLLALFDVLGYVLSILNL